MSKTAVIFGGAGYIGSHVVKEFIKAGYDVTVFDNFSTGLEDNLKFCLDKIKIVRGDIRFKSDFIHLPEHPDVVVCLSAFKHVDESMDPEHMNEYAEVNITGTLNVLWYTSTSNCKRFIFSSSAATFGEPDDIPIGSFDDQNPINFYG